MKLNRSLLTYWIICMYPFADILHRYIFMGNGMNYFFVFICCLIMAINIKKKNATRSSLIILVILLGGIVLSFIRETYFPYKVTSVLYTLTVLYFIFLCENRINIIEFKDNFIKKPQLFVAGHILFFAVLELHFLKYGFYFGWNTRVIKGPYEYPHSLAYMCLFLLCGCLFLIRKELKIHLVVLAGIDLVVILLTAVRSVYVALFIGAIYILRTYMKEKEYKRMTFLVFFGTVVLFIAYQKGLLDAFFVKTKLSVDGGYGLTNNRGNTIISSLKTFGHYGIFPFNVLFGAGVDVLYKNNYHYLGESIHAHNDFIDILVYYGVFSLIAYIYCFIRMCRINAKNYWLICFLAVLAYFNGLFTYIDSTPLLLFPILEFNYVLQEKFKFIRQGDN